MHSISQDFGLRIIFENSSQTVYTIDNDDSNSRMVVFHLYPGIEIILNDFKERYSWSGQWSEETRVFQIAYCHNGVYQAEFSKNKFSYSSPGNIVVLNSCKESLGSKMTTDILQGFNILIYPKLLTESVINDWQKQFDLNINEVLHVFSEIKKVKAFPCGAGMLHVAGELYELLYNNEIGIVRLKLLEFFHLILKEDYKVENKQRVFSREQIEKTKMIKEQIEINLAKHYTIQELCDCHGISTTIFKECFKQIFQNPPYEFLRIARMNKASEYLKNSELSILEIGKSLGYENPSNFTRTFKQIYGVLPKKYKSNQ